MIEKRHSNQRGVTDTGWLQSRHSFSFGGYFDANRVGHGALRVLNDDHVAASKGFDAHPHRNAEIVSYVLEGQLEHRDSLGNGDVIRAGQFQYMSAGRGVTHSEFNPAQVPVHFLQIWLNPNERDAEPTYAQADRAQLPDLSLSLVAAPVGANDSEPVAPIRWRADAELWLGRLNAGDAITLPQSRRHGYLHLTRGQVRVGEHELASGDALALTAESALEVTALANAEFLWFDVE